MKRGIVIGKFMPLHSGHIALVRFAAAHCDELVVVVASATGDPIPGDLRLAWVREEFKQYIRIRPGLLENPAFLQPRSTSPEKWAAVITQAFPDNEFLFSSDHDGDALAVHLGAMHVAFDPERNDHPVSATQIRERPFKYWDFIALPARGFFVKRICFYGPESTGKSTLAQRMAARYQTEFVPESAREFITSSQFTVEDIIKIGQTQTERVLRKTEKANKILFCDSDLITTQIYSHVYLKMVPEILQELENRIRYDRYFLFDIDVPWVADGLRDLGGKREEMMRVFRTNLDKRKHPYTLLSGPYAEREKHLVSIIDAMLNE